MSAQLLDKMGSCVRSRAGLLCLLAVIACAAPVRAQSSQDPIYVFHTTLGDMRVQLYPDVTPQTVANFLSYVNSGAYNSSFIHRSAKDGQNHPFVIQGGGYTVNSNAQVSEISANGPVTSEAQLSNTRGTIAMALSTGPNSGTDEWFFNEKDNSALLDGTSDGGPFTVFGKIVDSASLAVMDQIGALQTYDASSVYGAAFNQLPLYNYQSGTNVAQSNFVRITSISPAWAAASISTGTDGATRLLWVNAVGAETLWTLSANGSVSYAPVAGPFSGWTPKRVAAGPNGSSTILWVNTNGEETHWTVSATGATTDSPIVGPFSGYTPTDLSVGPDGAVHLLWDRTDGAETLWTFPAGGGATTYAPVAGPFSGWTAVSLAVGTDGATRLLWDRTDGAETLWIMPANGGPTEDLPIAGPISGWTPKRVAAGPNGSSTILWVNANGEETHWTIPAGGGMPIYSKIVGPFSGWTPTDLSVGPDGVAHLLWDNVSGQTTLWTFGASGTTYSPYYGPF